MAELQFRMFKDDSLGVMGLIWERVKLQCTTKKMVKDSEWFKEKILLAQAQEAGVILQEEQQNFLADGLEDLDSDGSINGDVVGTTYDSNILSENDVAQSVPPLEHDNTMVLSIIEQMQSQVEQCNT
ncbi:hypothetical protein Tco_1140774, partial [Tanacetum coccineum]